MRDILFRGKSIDDGSWVYGLLTKNLHGDICIIPYDSTFLYRINLKTLGQYTGVKDKDGEKIFEGDVIKCTMIYDVGCYPHFETETKEVKYIEGCFIPLYDCERNTYQVIGNIYDNPELIEK